jgi:hypothetical protein
MLPGRRNGAGTLLLFLARRLAIFLFVRVTSPIIISTIQPAFPFESAIQIRTNTEPFSNPKVESGFESKQIPTVEMLGEKRTGALLEKTRVMVGEMRHLYYNWPHELRSRYARRITHKAGRAPSFA